MGKSYLLKSSAKTSNTTWLDGGAASTNPSNLMHIRRAMAFTNGTFHLYYRLFSPTLLSLSQFYLYDDLPRSNAMPLSPLPTDRLYL